METKRTPSMAIESFKEMADTMHWMPDALPSQKDKVYAFARETVDIAVTYRDSIINLNSLTMAIYVLTDDTNFNEVFGHLVAWLRTFGVSI